MQTLNRIRCDDTALFNCRIKNKYFCWEFVHLGVLCESRQQRWHILAVRRANLNKRQYNHVSSFSVPKRKISTGLVKHYWGFREIHNSRPAIEKSILIKVKIHKLNGISCRHCQKENLFIAVYKCVAVLLNQRTEVMKNVGTKGRFNQTFRNTHEVGQCIFFPPP